MNDTISKQHYYEYIKECFVECASKRRDWTNTTKINVYAQTQGKCEVLFEEHNDGILQVRQNFSASRRQFKNI